MRHWRMMTAGLTGIVLGAGLALGGVTSASAATAGHWGAFAVSGSSRAYTGTMTLPGFPETTFTSTSRQASVISGATTGQGPSTPPGAVYGNSRNNTYLNQRPLADQPNAASAATTKYTFDGATPGSGGWSFVLGDVDADQVTLSATVPGGGAATVAQLGYQGSYNSCSTVSPGGWTCPADPGGVPAGQDRPTWDAATGVLTGNAAANDTAGATAWFTPTVPLATLTMTYQARSGLPVYQTWFANTTASLSGVATLDGEPLGGAVVTVTAPGGAEFTTTTGDDGRYVIDALTRSDGYVVDVDPPANASLATPSAPVSLRAGDATADVPFVTPVGTVAVTGTVVDTTGAPVADAPVVVTDPTTGQTLAETVTEGDGSYLVPGLPASTAVEVVVDGGTPVPVTTGADGAAPVVVPPVVVQAAVSTISGRVTVDGVAPTAVSVVELVADGEVVATTETAADGTYAFRVLPGVYAVRTTSPAAGATGPTERAADTSAGDAADVDFAFVVPVPVVVSQSGSVTDTDGTPVAGATVTARPVDAGSGAVIVATTGADGSFDLRGLTPGTPYRVSVAGTTPQDVTTGASGAAPTPLDFVVPVPTVDQPGTVTDADGAAAADVPVVAMPTDTSAGDVVTTTTTAADGSFDLTGLRPSTSYSVVAGSGDQASEPQVVVTPASGSGTPLSITLAAVTPAPSTPPTPGGATGGGGTGGGTVDGGSTAGGGGASSGGSTSGSLAFTGAEIAPAAIAAGILVLLGGGLLTFRAARNRRRTEHLQD